jgi:hypothetical protein
LPASALAAGGSAPISALASVIGARSPAWASRGLQLVEAARAGHGGQRAVDHALHLVR